MVLQGWANDSDGDSSEGTGYFARVSVSEAELAEVADAFREENAANVPWSAIVGHFLLTERTDGIVEVVEYKSERQLENDFRALFNAYHSDIDF